MRVPVAVWQPCELLYTCYSLPYLYLTLPYQLPGDSPGVIYKTAVAATEAVNRGFVEQKTSGLLANLTTTAGGAGGDQATSCRLRVHRGGGAAAVQRGSVAAGAPPGTKMRHSRTPRTRRTRYSDPRAAAMRPYFKSLWGLGNKSSRLSSLLSRLATSRPRPATPRHPRRHRRPR